jgi:hypothetical protein
VVRLMLPERGLEGGEVPPLLPANIECRADERLEDGGGRLYGIV